MDDQSQMTLFEGKALSPADTWDQDVARRTLDDLFFHTHQYKASADYHNLLRFIGRFRFYAPYNAMLVHIQLPGATFVAPAHRWLKVYGRRIKSGAQPLVILQPMGPVMFVFDVIATEAEEGALPLPPEVTNPFEVRSGTIGNELAMTIRNAVRDGVDIVERQAGAQSAGQISTIASGRFLRFQNAFRPEPKYVDVPRRYELLLNSNHSLASRYATLTHELAHLYCGHLGSPNPAWWPNRLGLSEKVQEFEAESVCYLLCSRLGIDNPSEQYLAYYVNQNENTPQISLECVMKAAGLIEQMGREALKLRKDAM
jgi:hypothetical protein